MLGANFALVFRTTLVTGNDHALKIKCSGTTLTVVAANTIIQDSVESVIGEDVFVIVSGAEDPHSYEPTSSEVSELEDADIIFRLGLDNVEPWWEEDWEDALVIELVKSDMLKEDELVEALNPHIWMDPNYIKDFTDDIRDTMISQDPSNTADFISNAADYKKILDALLEDIADAKSKYNGLKVVVNHPSFFYFFELLGIDRIATIERGEGKEPSAEDLAVIIEKMTEQDVNLIIANPQHETANIYELARSTNSKIALLTPLLNVEVTWEGETKTIETYSDMIKYDLWALGNPEDPPSALESLWIYLTLSFVLVALIIIFILIRRR